MNILISITILARAFVKHEVPPNISTRPLRGESYQRENPRELRTSTVIHYTQFNAELTISKTNI
jgi:hypothetical protein